jgi:hypothetical protein
MYYHKSIDIIDEELRTTQENLKDENIHFNYKIELTNVGFHYQEKTVLSDINLTINKGEKIELKIGKIYAILDCLKYNKTTSNKTIREKMLVFTIKKKQF